MEPDVLFWFYKEFDLCRERLRILRGLNPDARIYGLFGGGASQEESARQAVGDWLDDFWAFPDTKNAQWKWKNGDLMIARWFEDRGKSLDWSTLFILQWDILVTAPLQDIFSTLVPGQILLSGFRPVAEIAGEWWWTKDAHPDTRGELRAFKNYLETTFEYRGELYACLFVIVCLPRPFLERYVDLGPPESGFLEYKIPTLATALGIPVCRQHPYNAGGWNPSAGVAGLSSSSERFLNAIGYKPPLSSILRELTKRNGHRLFHPVRTKCSPWMLKPHNALWIWPLLRIWETSLRAKSACGTMLRRHIARGDSY